MVTLVSAYIFVALISIVVLFQITLAFGAPLGEYAMGGKFPGKFPPAMRIVAVFQAFILVFVGIIVLTYGRIILPGYYESSRIAIWFVLAFTILATLANLATKSKKEKYVWAPVSVVLLVATILILSQPENPTNPIP